jgi:acyl-coenzyme A thioesterase PaaI-like protein
MNSLTNPNETQNSYRALAALLAAHAEWLCAERRDGASVPLRAGEWELSAARGRVHFAYWTERGVRTWRVTAWDWTGERLRLSAVRRMGAERATLELVPRASARAGIETVRAARLGLCAQMAALACANLPGAQVESVRLSAGARRTEPGRYARIVLRARHEHVAVTGAVVELGVGEVDALVVSALLWWARLNRRPRYAALRKLSLVVARELCEATGQRLALLRAEMRRDITLYERDEAWQTCAPVDAPALAQVLTVAPRALRTLYDQQSDMAARLVALAPDAIDVMRARHGETLRFRGLAFARVRRTLGRERVWFGTDARRRLLDEANWPDLAKLLDELIIHRTAAAPDHRHALYRAAPEAWLESLLRRDITRLDPGLRLAPLHTQFRPAQQTGARPVDLLALRRDGRLAVIELKVSEDAALPLQGADYWRRVEAHRRAGHIAQARLFGDLAIADEPPLVYLAAPVFRFHRAFHTLARMVAPEIEIYRFDLNEDWRAGVHVVRRTRAN